MPDDQMPVAIRLSSEIREHFDQLDLPNRTAASVGLDIYVHCIAEYFKAEPKLAKLALARHADLLAALKTAMDHDDYVRIATTIMGTWK